MPYWRTETPSEIGALTSPQEYDPGVGETMWWGIKEGLRQSLFPAFRDIARRARERTDIPMGLVQPLSEEEWRSGPYFREGLEYPEQGISEEYAQILAERTDEASEAALVARKGGTVAFMAGTFIGGIPDPLNFLPFFGPAARAAAVAKAGRTAGMALLSAAEATTGALALEPFLFAQAAAFQEDRDLSDSFWNVGFAALVGAGFGTVASKVNLRGVQDHIQAKSQAVRQLMDRRSIDVEAELPQQRRPVNAAEVAQYEQALRTPARSRTPDQDALLRDIDVSEGKLLDMRAPPEDIPDRAADVAEPTTARNEGAHYKPVGAGEGILGAFYERSPGGRDVPVQALPETGAEIAPGGAPRAQVVDIGAPAPRKITFADQVPDAAEQSLPVLVDDEPSGITLHKGERDRSWQVRREGPQGRRIEGSGLTLKQAKATARELLKEAEAPAARQPAAAAEPRQQDPDIAALEDSLGRELDPDEIADIRGAEEEAVTLSRKARAYESAAACLFGVG